MICTVKHIYGQRASYAISAKGKQWRVGEVIDIHFLEGTPEQRRFVRDSAREWLKYANLTFRWDSPRDESDIRISFRENAGAWSYIGTDALFRTVTQATMNLGWLTRETILHEFGHMLGLKHEHQNPKGGIQWNEAEVIKDLSGPPNNWSIDQIRHNVLNKPLPNSYNSTEFDPDSIMLYPFPDSWVLNGPGTKMNKQLSEMDKKYIVSLYPKTGADIAPYDIL